jgi:hypothetical protein
VVIYVRQQGFVPITSPTNFSPPGNFLFKRGTTPQVGIMVVDEDSDPVTYPAGAVVTLGFKAPNPNNTVVAGTTAFDGAYAVSGSTAAAADESGIYWLAVGFSGGALDASLGYNPPDINDDVVLVTLAGEVRVDAGASIYKSLTLSSIVFHDINTGTEGAVTAAAYLFPQIWNTISALSGGAATDLDAQATAGVQTIGNLICMTGVAGVNAGGLTIWQLQAAAGRVTAAGLLAPLDFDAVVNDVIWVKVL